MRLARGAHTPYGFGWSPGEQRGERRFEHGGSWQEFRAALARYPDRQLAVAVLANLAGAPVETAAHAIAGLVDPRLAPRDPAAAPPDPDPARNARLRELHAAWAEFRVVPAMASGLAATASGSAREAGERARTGARLAAAKRFRYLGEDELTGAAAALLRDGAARAVDYALETAEARFVYRFLLDRAGRVLGFDAERR